MIDYKFFSKINFKQKNKNLISGVLPESSIINNVEESINYSGALIYIDSNVFDSTHINKDIYLERKQKSLITKILVDRAYETGLSESDYDEKILQLAKLGFDSEDILFVLNRSAYNEWMDKHIDRIILIDFFAVSAAIRHLIHKQPISHVTVNDRPNKINFLVGKVNKESRKIILNSFYQSKAKEKTIFSILGTIDGINDDGFENFIRENQGPIDNAYVQETNEGLTSQGWGNSAYVYDQSSVSFICETHESNPSLFLTEKTYRPIINRHPFVIRASFPALQYLNAIGFKTFANFIDESYDEVNEVNSAYSQRLIETTVDLLGKVKTNAKQMQSIVDHNYMTLIKFSQSELAYLNKRLFDSLK